MGSCASSCFSWAVALLEERVSQRFHDSSTIIAKEIFWANLQYLRSNGSQIRGNGALILTANVLWFTYVAPYRQVETRVENIRTVKVGRAQGLSRSLIIDFVDTDTGKEDQMVFAIRHPKRWEKWINETVQTSANSMPPPYWSVFEPLQAEYTCSCKSVISKISGAKADVFVNNGDKIDFGDQVLEVRSTPGHTNGCVTYVDHAGRMAFTGDALLIRACGRTDFQEGNPETLYESVRNQILSLPEDYMLYPAHDYHGVTTTTVGEELKYNPRLTKSKKEFVEIMEQLGLTRPAKMDEAVPINVMCGPSQLGESHQRMDK